jgi:rhomboid protease GluP
MTPAEPADRGRIPDLPRIPGESGAWTTTGLTNGVDVPSGRGTPTWLRVPRFPVWATNILLGLLVVVWLYESYVGGSLAGSERIDVLRQLGAKDNGLIVQGEYWRLITAMFLHAGFLHIAFNGYALLIFGQQVERFYGWARFLAIYFIAGLAGSIASFAFSPAISVGASGAIFGVMGAMGAFFWVQRRLLGAMARTQLWNAVTIIGINILFGLSQSGAIDNMAHGGGLIGGLIAGFALAPRYRPGPALGPDERMLEDRLPWWAFIAVTVALLAVELLLFAAALAYQKGHL